MIPREPSNPGQRARLEPLFDIHPQTGASLEVFYADHSLETFGRCGAGWFWQARQAGLLTVRFGDRSVCYELPSVPACDEPLWHGWFSAERGARQAPTRKVNADIVRTRRFLERARVPANPLILMVPRGGIEPPTLRFSVACSTN